MISNIAAAQTSVQAGTGTWIWIAVIVVALVWTLAIYIKRRKDPVDEFMRHPPYEGRPPKGGGGGADRDEKERRE